MTARTTSVGIAVAMSTLLLLAPAVSAITFGSNTSGLKDLQDANLDPKHTQMWVGSWTKGHWSSYENNLRTARDNGVTPVVLWYYWGDGISPDAVKYGTGSKSKSDWDAMAKELASRTHAVMGSRTVIFVLEPEFNKNGISSWETFDGYLENQARILKSGAPNAKTVVGFGHWGGWSLFDRAVAASDYSGFQILRGSTRDTSAKAEASADYALKLTKDLKAMFGKNVVLFDLGISSYGGWEGVQERAIRGFGDKRAELDAAGLKIIIWRHIRDNDHSSGYFGSAESYWGVKTASGTEKRGWKELVRLFGSSSTSTSSTTSTSTSTSSSPSPDATFSKVSGNEWWVQAKVAGSPSKVEVRVDDGTWRSMSLQSWGYWTRSTAAPDGSTVELRATFGDGSVVRQSYRWTDATPITSSTSTSSGSTSTSSSTSSGADVFSGVRGNEWWVQAKVAGSPSKVDVRVDGGTWRAMSLQSWGSWARSVAAPEGSTVELRATFGDGSTAAQAYRWTDATPLSSSSSGSTSTSSSGLAATFSAASGNAWWVQIDVAADKSLAKVEARVDGGSWKEIPKASWGTRTYAGTMRAPDGSKVEFRATASDGSSTTSPTFSWLP